MPGRGREDKPVKVDREHEGHSLVKQLTRIADALDRAYPPPEPTPEPVPTVE